MDRQGLVDEIVDYFNASDDWRRRLALLQDPDPRGSHVHTYVYTSVHPESLEPILRRYFDMLGSPIVRRINWIRPRPNIGDLHGCESTWIESVLATETFEGQTLWDGTIEVFELIDHPTSTRCYAWSHAVDGSETPLRRRAAPGAGGLAWGGCEGCHRSGTE